MPYSGVWALFTGSTEPSQRKSDKSEPGVERWLDLKSR